MAKPTELTHVERRLVQQFWERKAANARTKRIDNAKLPVGAPMTYYCHGCGCVAAVLPETHVEPAPRYCERCLRLDMLGLMPPPKPDRGSQ